MFQDSHLHCSKSIPPSDSKTAAIPGTSSTVFKSGAGHILALFLTNSTLFPWVTDGTGPGNPTKKKKRPLRGFSFKA